jgi:hypothetical protein
MHEGVSMTSHFSVHALALALAIAPVALCAAPAAAESATATKRFAIEVSATVAGKVYTGRDIWEERLTYQPVADQDFMPYSSDIRGEAIVLKAEDGDELLMLKRSATGYSSRRYGQFIEQCLADWDVELDKVAALTAYSGSCDLEARPVVLHHGEAMSGTFTPIQYCTADSTGACLDGALKLTLHTTDEPVSDDIARSMPTILASLPSTPAGSVVWTKQYHLEDFTTEFTAQP